VIKAAEEHLKSVSQHQGYGIAVLKVCGRLSLYACLFCSELVCIAPLVQVIAAGDALGTDVRLAAAVNFKNLVKYRWVSARTMVQQLKQQLLLYQLESAGVARRCPQSWLRRQGHSQFRMQKRWAIQACTAQLMMCSV
jgi:hypothetical protein